jgi:hypothetical protein
MVNTYKALSLLARGDFDNARVEFNRLDERQARTAQQFAAEIAAARDATDRRASENRGSEQAISNAFATPEAREQTDQLRQWAIYSPFQNPAATYLSGLFFLNSTVTGDAERARTQLQRTAGMVRNNAVVAADLALAEASARGRRPAPHVWVVFENGQAPTFIQQNITFPAPVIATTGGISVRPVTVSVPRLVIQPSAYQALEVRAGRARVTTALVGSIEGVMASEFNQRWPGHVRDAVIEGFSKIIGMSAVNVGMGAAGRQMGGMGGLALMLAAEIATTAAGNITTSDTRSWHSLPQEFQVARLPVPADGAVSISALGGPSATAQVAPGRSAIILVKAQAPGSPLTIQVIQLTPAAGS